MNSQRPEADEAAGADRPSSPNTKLALQVGRAMEQRGDVAGALRAYRLVLGSPLATGGARSQATLGLARCAERLGQFPQAEQAYRQAASAATHDRITRAAALLGLAGVAERLGQFPEAEQAYRQAASAATFDTATIAAALLGLAGVAERQGQLPQAEQAYRQAVNTATHATATRDAAAATIGAWAGLAGVAERMGELSEARNAYQKVIENISSDQYLATVVIHLAASDYPTSVTEPYDHAFHSEIQSGLTFDFSTDRTLRTIRDSVAAISREAGEIYIVEAKQYMASHHRGFSSLIESFGFRYRAPLSFEITAKFETLPTANTWISTDQLTLWRDAITIDGDFNVGMVGLIINEHPSAVTRTLPDLIVHVMRSDIQQSAKRQAAPNLDDEELSRLRDTLQELARANETGDSTNSEPGGQ